MTRFLLMTICQEICSNNVLYKNIMKNIDEFSILCYDIIISVELKLSNLHKQEEEKWVRLL